MGGKSKAQTIGFWYRILLHLGIGRGELDAFLELRGGDKTAWIGEQTGNGTLLVNARNLWGGEKAEGGIYGQLEVLLGGPSQSQSALLTSNAMGQQSHYRGRAAIAFVGDWGAFNPYPKPASMRVRRILKGWDGDAPWYPAKAAIPLAVMRRPVEDDTVWNNRSTGFWVIGAAQETSGTYSDFQGWWHGNVSSFRVTKGVARYALQSYQVPTSEFGTSVDEDPHFGAVKLLLLMEGGEGSTTFVDVKGHTVEAFGGAHITTARAKFGASSAVFDGIDDWLKATMGADEDLGAVWTMDAWVWLNSTVNDFYSRAVFGYGPLSLGGGDTTWYAQGNAWQFNQLEPGNILTVNVSQNIEPYAETGRWAFVSVCRDSSGRYWLHQDGKLLTADGTLKGMNPAHMLYDSLTAMEMQGEPVALIDEPSFIAAADRFYSESFGLCTKYDPKQESVDAFQARILDVIGASLSQSRITGKYELVPIRGDYDPETLPILGDDNILEYSEQPSDPLGQVNQVTVEWFDPVKKEKRSTTPLQNLGAIQASGGIIAEAIARPEIAVESLALRVGARDLRQRSTPLKKFELTTDRTPYAWRAGQLFRLQAPRRGIADMVCMVGEIDAGTPRSGTMHLKVVQDVAGMPDTTYVTAESGIDTTPSTAAGVPPHQAAFEAPYIDLVGSLSPADLAALEDTIGYLLTVAERPTVGNNYALFTAAAGEDLVERGTADWCPTLVVPHSATADPSEVSFAFAQSADMDQVEVGSAALWGSELVRVDALDTTAATVTFGRGIGDTVPKTHAAGERVWFYDQASGSDAREYADGEVVTARLATIAASSRLPVDAASASTVTMDSRQARPYAPGKFRINGAYVPAAVDGSTTAASVTWAHRDRVGQGDTLVDSAATSIGPESTTRYALRLTRVDTGALLVERTDLAGPSCTFALTYTGNVRAQLWAISDNGESWTRHDHSFAYTKNPATVTNVITGTAYTAPPATIIDGGTVG